MHKYPTYQCLSNGFLGILFCFKYRVLSKHKKDLVSTHSEKLFFSTFLLIIVRNINMCKILAENIQLYMSWSLAKSLFIQTNEFIFLEIIKVFLDGDISICIMKLVLPNYINHASHEKLDQRLTFSDNVSYLCKKANGKSHAITRIKPFINLAKTCFWNTFFSYHNLTVVLSYGYSIVKKNYKKIS